VTTIERGHDVGPPTLLRPIEPEPPADAQSPANEDSDRRRGALAFGWERLSFAGLIVGTALLYLVGLSKSGWANQFYSAAVQSGSRSWTAMLFGSLDAGNFITVDKPPASLWIMDISARIFGVNSWSILVPQALEGVAAVAILYAAVKRVSTHTAGLLSGAILATTPVAALMFRFDNPDALLVLLMTAAAYGTVRAVEKASWRWLALAGALLGLAFLTKMLQGLLVVPAFGAAYLVAAPTGLARRIRHSLIAFAALIGAAGWWIALVELWPGASRPYIGGTNTNSILELTFGYNGIGRLTGSSNNGSVNGGTGGFSSSETGWTRLFGSEMGTQISWLLPAALVAIGALIWLTWRRPRTDILRASVIVWGGWLLVTGVVLSFASGIIHPYYTVALAPAIAACVGIGVGMLWRARSQDVARWLLAGIVAVGAWWTFDLLGRANWHPELRWLVLLAGAVGVATVMMPAGLGRRVGVVAVPAIGLALLAGPTAYAVQTASTAHTGAIPSAGPGSAGGFGGGGFGGGRGGVAGAGPGGGPGGTGGGTGGFGGGAGGFGGGAGGFGGANAPTGATGTGATGTGAAPTNRAGGGPGGGGGGGGGGLGGATTVSSALKAALNAGASNYTWVAATTGDNEAASLELGTGNSVISLGGYNGTDPAITLAAFEKLVAGGKVHFYVADASGFIGSTSAQGSTAYQIQQWVEANFTAQTVGGTTIYDLTTAK
jgi:4-amino-4-deoxy-L-arabinose transferase-like glycosyltransferase